MIHFVLNDLRRPAGEVFRARLHFQGLILYLDDFIALALTGAAEKQLTVLLSIVCAINISNKSCKGCNSSLVAISDFTARNIGLCRISLSISLPLYADSIPSIRDKS